jgi:shikimate kinase
MSAPLLIFVGLRCVGKSTLGYALAKGLGWGFVDLDTQLADRHGADSVGDLLGERGLEGFRDLEQELLAELVQPRDTPMVLATGGGVVERGVNRKRLQDLACVWLDVPMDLLAQRLESDASNRPSLTGKAPSDEFEELRRRRAPWYEQVAGPALELGESGTEAALDLIRAHVRARFGHFGEQ